jgi:Na+-transporting NADH:ubiquinone oxidoreductase subunit C
MARESVQNTFLIAGLLAVVCSALVSTSAVLLRPLQAKNQDLDRKKNILQAAGIFEKGKPIEEQFQKFEIKVVDLATGERVGAPDPRDANAGAAGTVPPGSGG